MKKHISLLIILLFVAACSSTQSPPPSRTENRPPLIINEVAGTYINENSLANVRIGENVKAYSLGRLIDDADPSLMQEGGIIYRIESSSGWNRQPGMPPKLPFTETAPIIIGEDSALLRAEIEVKANEQRRLYRFIKEAADQAAGKVDVLSESIDIGKKLSQQNHSLQQQLQSSREHNKKLLKTLLDLQNKFNILLKFNQKKEEEKIHSKYRRK